MASDLDFDVKRHRVYLGLGSNLGEREENLRQACEKLMANGVTVLEKSPLYQTAPWGGVEQPDFLNAVLLAETELAPEELLVLVKRLEEEIGRRPTVFWGPRVIDIDILLYEELTFDTEKLTIPHREIKNRAFVLLPLLRIAPGLILPDGEAVADCYARLPQAEKDGVVLYAEGENFWAKQAGALQGENSENRFFCRKRRMSRSKFNAAKLGGNDYGAD